MLAARVMMCSFAVAVATEYGPDGLPVGGEQRRGEVATEYGPDGLPVGGEQRRGEVETKFDASGVAVDDDGLPISYDNDGGEAGAAEGSTHRRAHTLHHNSGQDACNCCGHFTGSTDCSYMECGTMPGCESSTECPCDTCKWCWDPSGAGGTACASVDANACPAAARREARATAVRARTSSTFTVEHQAGLIGAAIGAVVGVALVAGVIHVRSKYRVQDVILSEEEQSPTSDEAVLMSASAETPTAAEFLV